MKRVFAIAVIGLVLLCEAVTAYKSGDNIDKEKYYPATMIVAEVNQEADTVTVEDSEGFLFEFYGIEDYNEGDVVSMIMNKHGTESIFDDEIVCVQHSGYNITALGNLLER